MNPPTTKTPVFSFLNGNTCITMGEGARFDSVLAAEKWLTTHSGRTVGGLVPYEYGDGKGCSLFGGTVSTRTDAPAGDGPGLRYDVRFNSAETERYLHALDAALEALRGGDNELDKVVLSRVERYLADGLDAGALYRTICEAYPKGNNFCVRDQHRPHSFHLGSSPELFLRRRGRRIVLHPLAGTLPKDPQLPEEDDRRRAQRVLDTPKFREEHAYLVDFLRDGLADFCAETRSPDEPSLVSASDVWHLGTLIEGTLRSDEIALSEMLEVLHPSPAVCGTPRDLANGFIAEHETERDYYAGLVGWMEGPRDCEFYMALRSMEADCSLGHVDLRAGGGIVRGSSVPMEFGEISAKMSTMQRILRACGASTESGHVVRA